MNVKWNLWKRLSVPSLRTRRNRTSLLARVSGALILVAIGASSAGAQPLTFATFAGPAGGSGSADGLGSAARFFDPGGVAVDRIGNIYVADTDNSTIRKITPAGMVTTLAGLAGMRGSSDGTGSAARFDGPGGLALDGGGNVYVADSNNHTIRKITPAGLVTTLAGSAGLAGSADGAGSAALFHQPNGAATDRDGNLYVADSGNSTIRKITPAGLVTTLAGSAGVVGTEDGAGSAARFFAPWSVATDGAGNIYVADRVCATIRKITPAGVVTTLAGLALVHGSADGIGNAARFYGPSGVATDGGGNIYVTDRGNDTIRRVDATGAVTTLAGSAGHFEAADGIGSAARFSGPGGLATDSGGNVYVADTYNNAIRKISPAAMVTTLAGSASLPGSADGADVAARFDTPNGVATDLAGNVYVADDNNQTIRKITSAGVVSTLAGLAPFFGNTDGTGSSALFYHPAGVAADSSGNVYVADRYNSAIRKITRGGVVTTLAGSAGFFGSFDGTGSAARFSGPAGVAIDRGGNVYVADYGNDAIRKVTPAGLVTTLAGLPGVPGSPGVSGSADGAGSAARFNHPIGVATDNGDHLYVADYDNHTIRAITMSNGVVTTLAGSPGVAGSADGTGNAARFSHPAGVATDVDGNVYVADQDNHTIRKITPAGMVTTLAGSAGLPGSDDGTGSAASFRSPTGVATDNGGNLYVADSGNNKIRVGRVALADAATIDGSTGPVGSTRRLDTTSQTATSWQWTLIRQPSASSAQLSSASIRNPTFTPDVADVYIFRLTASNGAMTSVTTVSLIATTPLTRRRVAAIEF
jgi:sugar lactone lactonase YvrE